MRNSPGVFRNAVLLGAGLMMFLGGCSRAQVASSSDKRELDLENPPVEEMQRSSVVQQPAQPVEVVKREDTVPIPAPRTSLIEVPATSAPSGLHGLDDIFFDYDRFTIQQGAQTTLGDNARWLRGEHGKKIVIEGHCDERGTSAYNLVLGEKRARSAKHYLEDLGIPPSQIQIASFGEARPFCQDHNEQCWQKNRRAHFVAQ